MVSAPTSRTRSIVPAGATRYASHVSQNRPPPMEDDPLLRATLDYAAVCDGAAPSADDHARAFAPFRDALHARLALEVSRGVAADVAGRRIVIAVRGAVPETVSGPVAAHIAHAAQSILESAAAGLGPGAA